MSAESDAIIKAIKQGFASFGGKRGDSPEGLTPAPPGETDEAARKRIMKDREKLNASYEKQVAQTKEISDWSEKRAKQEEASIAHAYKKIELEKQDIDLKVKSGELTEEEAELEKGMLDGQKEELEVRKKILSVKKDGIKAAQSLAGSMTNVLKIQGKMGVKATGMTEAFSKGAIEMFKVAKGGRLAAAAFGKAFILSAVTKYVSSIVDLTLSLYDAENAFRRATGADREFAKGITNSFDDVRQYGIGIEEVTKASKALYKYQTDFTMLNADVRKEITNTGVVLEEYGVSNEQYAKGVQMATKMLGVTAREVDDEMRGLTAHAQDIGVAPQELMASFDQARGSIAKLGKDGVKAFKDLAITSKITGLEMEKILRMTNKFDTFEGAAEQAGKLNAALGGNFVNAMDLMMATDPNERFMMIRDSLEEAGLSFDSMSYHQRQFYAESLGMEDVGDLALMMSGNLDALDDSIGMTTADYETMADEAKKMASFQDQLNAVFMQMIPILKPLIGYVGELMTWLAEEKNVKMLQKMIGAFVMLASVLFTVLTGGAGGALGGIAGLTAGFSLYSGALTDAEKKTDGITLFFEGLWEAMKEVYEIGLKPLIEEMKVVFDIWMELFSELGLGGDGVSGIQALGLWIGRLAHVLRILIIPMRVSVWLTTQLVGAFTSMVKFFKKKSSPTFIEYLMHVATAFKEIGLSIVEIFNPIKQITALMKTFGDMISSILSGITSFFTVLASPGASSNITEIVDAVARMPERKMIELGATMVSTAGALAAAGYTSAKETVKEYVGMDREQTAAAGGGGRAPIKVVLQLNAMQTKKLMRGAAVEINTQTSQESMNGIGGAPIL